MTSIVDAAAFWPSGGGVSGPIGAGRTLQLRTQDAARSPIKRGGWRAVAAAGESNRTGGCGIAGATKTHQAARNLTQINVAPASDCSPVIATVLPMGPLLSTSDNLRPLAWAAFSYTVALWLWSRRPDDETDRPAIAAVIVAPLNSNLSSALRGDD
jgi:hypothetical protein